MSDTLTPARGKVRKHQLKTHFEAMSELAN